MVAARAPGIYIEDVSPPSNIIPLTGVPGFVGFFSAKPENELPLLNTPLLLNRQQEFTDKFKTKGYLTEAVVGFFQNGGSHCYVVRADPDKKPMTALMEAIDVLAGLIDIDLVVVPDAMALFSLLPDDTIQAKTDVISVQQHMLHHCAKHGDRLAIIDALPNSDKESLEQQISQLAGARTEEEAYAALYYPWIQVTDTSSKNLPENRLVPPGGHIAGIFARSDRERGVFKAPANEEIRNAIALEKAIDNFTQGELNAQGINCLQAFTGRGIRIWGARTLSQAPNWRYINVRRLFLTLKRWIDLNMGWATFEPNTPLLWNRIRRELNSYLTQLWRKGALKGTTEEQAFYVRCDMATNPPENREYGKISTEIGLAPSSPAEFIVVQITLHMNTTEAS